VKTYALKEIFYSLQGEGARAGSPNVFIRLAGCNLKCTVETHGFNCDTDFSDGFRHTAEEIGHIARSVGRKCRNVILTGGEPLLQVDDDLHSALWLMGFSYVAVETNGTLPIPWWVDYASVSPKVPEEDLRCCEKRAFVLGELRYVIAAGQPLPQPRCVANHYFLSPAFDGEGMNIAALNWCIELIRDNPQWRLSVQQHKAWGIR
jgi:organic radical activating enzyme